MIVAPAAKNRRARVLVAVLIGPLPDVTDEIFHTVGTCSARCPVTLAGGAVSRNCD